MLIALVIYKWPDFFLPFFWDELGVYCEAVAYQYHHHLSLMPGSVSPEFSHGHPLFFICLNACVQRIFGPQLFVTHFFCFSISLLLLLVVYLKISRYFSPEAGLLSVLILAVQPVFLAQAALLLPEICLALLIFLSLCFYYENRFWLFAIFASLAAVTKEPAIALPAVVIFYSLLRYLVSKQKPQALKLMPVLLTLFPYLVFASFLLLQKMQNGWYFFPYHMDTVNFSLGVFGSQLRTYAVFIFREQGRYLITSVLVAGAIFSAVKGKWNSEKISRSFTWLLVLYCLAHLIFNSFFSIYMARYMTAFIVMFSVLAAASLTAISKNRYFLAITVLAISFAGYNNLESATFNYDADQSYTRQVKTMQQAISYIIHLAGPGGKVMANFPAYYALKYSEGGYLGSADYVQVVCLSEKNWDSNSVCIQIFSKVKPSC